MKKCRNCNADIEQVPVDYYCEPDPVSANVKHNVTEKICPVCGHRNQRRTFEEVGVV